MQNMSNAAWHDSGSDLERLAQTGAGAMNQNSVISHRLATAPRSTMLGKTLRLSGTLEGQSYGID